MIKNILLYAKQASVIYLQKDRTQSCKARLSTTAHKKRDILLSPKPRRYAIPCSPERKGNTRTPQMVSSTRRGHHVGFEGKWLG
jgi:hypothetical protein